MGTGGAPAADTACFNAAIVACDRGGQWARAAALVAEMRGRGLRCGREEARGRGRGEWRGKCIMG
jgi:hypothetical protein